MFGAERMNNGLKALAPALLVAGGWMNVASGQVRVDARPDDRGCGHADCRRVWVPPVIEKRMRNVWVPPRTEMVHRRVWHEAVYEDRNVLVDIPAVTEWREVASFDAYGRFVGYRWEEVVITPACQRWELRRVLVREGWFEDVCEQVVICPGRWESVCEDVVVREGFWKTVCEHRPVPLIEDLRRHSPPLEAKPVRPVTIQPMPDRREYPVGNGGRPPTSRVSDDRFGAFDRLGMMGRFGAAVSDKDRAAMSEKDRSAMSERERASMNAKPAASTGSRPGVDRNEKDDRR